MKHKIGKIMTGIVLMVIFLAGAYYMYETHVIKMTDGKNLLDNPKTQESYQALLSESLSQKNRYEKIVVINPAHGGSDSGFASEYGTEKDITLAIAKKIQDKNQDEKIGIFLTRIDDTGPDLSMRSEFIEKMQPDIVIDLHVRKNSASSSFGASVYYQTGYYDYRLTNMEFADLTEIGIVTETKGYALGIFEDTKQEFPLLSGLKVPAVSVECGNIMNPTEGVMLTKDKYQEHIADGVLEAVSKALPLLDET